MKKFLLGKNFTFIELVGQIYAAPLLAAQRYLEWFLVIFVSVAISILLRSFFGVKEEPVQVQISGNNSTNIQIRK